MVLTEHIGDKDLVSYLDGELEGAFQESICAHLENCPDCTSSLNAYKQSIESFLKMRSENLFPGDLPQTDRALELFRERLTEHRTSVESRSYFSFESGRLYRNIKSLFGGRQIYNGWNWSGLGIGFAAVILLASAIISTMFFTKRDLPSAQVINEDHVPETKKNLLENNQLSETSKADSRGDEMNNSSAREVNFIQRTSFRAGNSRRSNLSQKSNFRKPFPESGLKPPDDFFPITYAENMEEAKRNGLIISATLSRTALSALGLNMPVENEISKVKTELLISSDGIVRGVRFIK